jgi:transcription antitermination protein NusB
MISRRLVRIKTLQTLYSWNQSEETDLSIFSKELYSRIQEVHDFYLFLLDFPYQLQQFALDKQEVEKNKYYPDKSKIEYYSLLNNTPLIGKIHQSLLAHDEYTTFDWSALAGQMDGFYSELKSWDFSADYAFFIEPNLQQQKEFVDQLFFAFIETNEAFNNSLEEVNPSWYDDMPFAFREIQRISTVDRDRVKINLAPSIQPKDEEVLMGAQLLSKTVNNSKKYEELIGTVTDNWDPSRIAVMDLLILKLTLTEFLHFPDVPLKVTINEYLEITKNYSTPNSSKFVNGIMDKLRIDLEGKGEIHKSARGMK